MLSLMKMQSLDVSALIRYINERPPLWDRKNSFYHDRNVSKKLWEEVAGLLNADVDTVRFKWKGLRDTFRVELKKLNKAQLFLSSDKTSTQWEYFKEMEFVKDQMYSSKRSLQNMLNQSNSAANEDSCSTTRSESTDQTSELEANEPTKPPNSVPIKEEPIEIKEEPLDSDNGSMVSPDNSEHDNDLDLSTLCSTEIVEGTDTIPKSGQIRTVNGPSVKKPCLIPSNVDFYDNRKFVRTHPGVQQSLSFDQKKLRRVAEDDYNFLISLLPTLKSLPKERNLYVRIRMQELLYNEIVTKKSHPRQD